jgi:hypothetical protein
MYLPVQGVELAILQNPGDSSNENGIITAWAVQFFLVSAKIERFAAEILLVSPTNAQQILFDPKHPSQIH